MKRAKKTQSNSLTLRIETLRNLQVQTDDLGRVRGGVFTQSYHGCPPPPGPRR